MTPRLPKAAPLVADICSATRGSQEAYPGHWSRLPGLPDLEVLRLQSRELLVDELAGRIVHGETGVAHHHGEGLVVGRGKSQGKLTVFPDAPAWRESVREEPAAGDGQAAGRRRRSEATGLTGNLFRGITVCVVFCSGAWATAGDAFPVQPEMNTAHRTTPRAAADSLARRAPCPGFPS